jgi:broad specificity phosphatase PhoE
MTILIIRHAEKPKADDDPHLSDKGRRRAEALVALFQTCFHAPDKLYAAADKPKSWRPRETLEPLAKTLEQTIDSETSDVNVLASKLRGKPDASLVLISWRHEHIPALAQALGAEHVPANWPDNIYDRIWRLMRLPSGALHVADLPMALLPGDSLSATFVPDAE